MLGLCWNSEGTFPSTYFICCENSQLNVCMCMWGAAGRGVGFVLAWQVFGFSMCSVEHAAAWSSGELAVLWVLLNQRRDHCHEIFLDSNLDTFLPGKAWENFSFAQCPEAIFICFWCVILSFPSKSLPQRLSVTFWMKLGFLLVLLCRGILAPVEGFLSFHQ